MRQRSLPVLMSPLARLESAREYAALQHGGGRSTLEY
jgi:hypothetical protein